jgi:hypothetical protein
MKGKSTLAGRPLDAVEDFDKATRNVMQNGEQKDLPGITAEAPQAVRGKMMLAKYVRPHYEKDEKDTYSVSLEFSFPLTKEHEGLLPSEVAHFWKIMKKGGTRKIVDIDIEPHAVDIHLAPDDGVHISLDYARIGHAQLALIEETGSGKAQDVIRFSFRSNHESAGPENKALREFADNHFDKSVWIKLQAVQGSLLKAHEADGE